MRGSGPTPAPGFSDPKAQGRHYTRRKRPNALAFCEVMCVAIGHSEEEMFEVASSLYPRHGVEDGIVRCRVVAPGNKSAETVMEAA